MIRPTCCGDFPLSVCADCPHATDEQRAAGGMPAKFTTQRPEAEIHSGSRCDLCFLPLFEHGPGGVCPVIAKPAPAPVEQVVVVKPVAPVAPPKPRAPCCPSCSKEWNGQRQAKGAEGMHCGTCGQAMVYS